MTVLPVTTLPALSYMTPNGYPITTVHYLTDGLLKIEYGQMTENREPVITNIEFSEDYKMTDALGREVNYKIFDNDLPW